MAARRSRIRLNALSRGLIRLTRLGRSPTIESETVLDGELAVP